MDSVPLCSLDFRSENQYGELLKDAASRASRYLETIRERHVGVPAGALHNLAALGGPLSSHGEDPRFLLKLLDEVGSPATVASAGSRFFGGVIGGALPVTVAAHWLADVWDQNACLFDLSPVSAYLEDVVLAWVLELFGLPPRSGGAFVTGTQMADVTALAAARYAALLKSGWDVQSEGMFGAPPVTVVVGEEVHATMWKALALLGFGRSRVLVVPADSQGRMCPSGIPRLKRPMIICVQAGNVNTGACDPIDEICDIAGAMDAWVHVDGAFGLWAAASPARKQLVDGVARADSWATDAHKWLNVPQDSGIAIVRQREALRHAMSITASYYPDPAGKREPMQWGPESSRRARAIEIWAALRSLGTEGVADLIERTCQHAAKFAEGFRAAGYEVLNDVVLNQVLVSFGDGESTARIIAAIQEEGTCWCGGTLWKGRRAMRISVSSWATTDADVTCSLQAMLAIASGESKSKSQSAPLS
ncbi:MAG TPA: aminotransferase class V-fold PLP-dependent enzyme [Candidatus Acidoferrales bacterium]|nr:aminotransferase class V-fold PLP-dependent enzyme [Candidatus Acidoferrales bacterium]